MNRRLAARDRDVRLHRAGGGAFVAQPPPPGQDGSAAKDLPPAESTAVRRRCSSRPTRSSGSRRCSTCGRSGAVSSKVEADIRTLERRRSRTAPMTAGHFIFIPSVLLVGVVIGWILGSRAARDAFAAELRRRDERRLERPTDQRPLTRARRAAPAAITFACVSSTRYFESKQLDALRVRRRRSRRRRADRRRAADRPIRG